MQKQPQEAGPDLQAFSSAGCPAPREESGVTADGKPSSLNPYLTSNLRAALEAKGGGVTTTTATGLPWGPQQMVKAKHPRPTLPTSQPG